MEMSALQISPASAYGARQRVVPISDASGVAEARRAAAQLAQQLSFDETTAGELALSVTEAASNIAKHAREGAIVARILQRAGDGGIEVLAIDKGPGMDVAVSMRDGHSTAGTPGAGLGALRRMASELEIWSRPGGGTLLRFEVWPKAAAGNAVALAAGVICAEKRGEPVSGDSWALQQGRGRVIALVVDGLGHGLDAAEAARAAVEVVQAKPDLNATDLMDTMHAALRPTRGAAGAIAMLQPESELCTYCGIGNISGSIRANGTSRSMVSQNGTLGHQVRRIQEFQYPFPKGSLLVMHSDGVATHWDLAGYPGIEARHPAIVAAALFRDHSRNRDDLTVLTLRNRAGR
jgi:anti-sigma regulatory factor (Ser/Thr protein kinase)